MKVFFWIYILLATLISVTSACSQNRAKAVAHEKESSTLLKAEGVVTNQYAEQGCEFLIKVRTDDGKEKLLYPISLDKKYKEEGKKIRFSYRKSRAPRKGECTLGLLIAIGDIEPL